MDKRTNIRERRSEKLRRLQQGTGRRAEWGPEGGHWDFPELREPAPGRETRTGREEAPVPPWIRDDRDPELRPDPEVEWNRKWQQEWSRYGAEPPYEGRGGGGRQDGAGSRFALKLLLSGLLFAAVWGMYRWDHPWAEKGKGFVTTQLNQSMDVNAIAAWYEESFGSIPSFLPAMNPAKHQEAEKVDSVPKHYFVPLQQGKLIAPFTPVQGGVLVSAPAGAPVAALDTGRVEFAGTKEDSGFTVILRHADGVQSIYGHLKPGTVRASDWIKGGETIGTVADPPEAAGDGTLFFAVVSKDGKALNPADVIAFE
ncbi:MULTISPECIES: M23 family metallopeptidase [Paenibacillus]|uniref:M23 family metallopeptidase n=1 Tax=Paenibacillus TaxID=44249 RepID=UPI0022B8DBC0|nr:M23 family metallopeptidase [Paenibacillus caseinilyticus]MCZ8519084.1 M23 family metallopeptidase [Paenibacillus caseinilyticus]